MKLLKKQQELSNHWNRM